MPDERPSVLRASISFTPEALACLDALCERAGLDRSAVVSLLVMRAIKEPEGAFLEKEMPPDAERLLAAMLEKRG